MNLKSNQTYNNTIFLMIQNTSNISEKDITKFQITTFFFTYNGVNYKVAKNSYTFAESRMSLERCWLISWLVKELTLK